MDSSLILLVILVIISFEFCLETILDLFNVSYKPKELPLLLKGVYKQEEYEKSSLYQKENTYFGLISSIVSTLFMIVVFKMGLLGSLNSYLSNDYQGIVLSLLFFGSAFLISDLINTPFSIYKQFVIEEKYGFNKMSFGTFLLDKIKGYALAALLGAILLGSLLWLIETLGSNFWIVFWVIIGVFIVFMNMFYTSFIVPLFNKLTPLEDEKLRAAIEEYSEKVNFPLDNIYVVDGSKRSSKANAYFSGIGKKKKIVLYDTLIENQTTEELVAVLAHEVGHFKRKHIIQGLILSLLQIGAILFLLSFFVQSTEISKALGADSLQVHLNLVAFIVLFSPISTIIGILMSVVSRKNEYEADEYAATTYSSKHIQSALKKLSNHNMSNLTPHPAYVFVHYSHPTLLQRLTFLQKYN